MAARRALAILVFAAAALPAPAAELGTLFYTPQERERLDRLRRGEPVGEAEGEAVGTPRVTGYVRRSDGRDTVFLDGRAYPAAGPRPAAAPARNGAPAATKEPEALARPEAKPKG